MLPVASPLPSPLLSVPEPQKAEGTESDQGEGKDAALKAAAPSEAMTPSEPGAEHRGVVL